MTAIASHDPLFLPKPSEKVFTSDNSLAEVAK